MLKTKLNIMDSVKARDEAMAMGVYPSWGRETLLERLASDAVIAAVHAITTKKENKKR